MSVISILELFVEKVRGSSAKCRQIRQEQFDALIARFEREGIPKWLPGMLNQTIYDHPELQTEANRDRVYELELLLKIRGCYSMESFHWRSLEEEIKRNITDPKKRDDYLSFLYLRAIDWLIYDNTDWYVPWIQETCLSPEPDQFYDRLMRWDLRNPFAARLAKKTGADAERVAELLLRQVALLLREYKLARDKREMLRCGCCSRGDQLISTLTYERGGLAELITEARLWERVIELAIGHGLFNLAADLALFKLHNVSRVCEIYAMRDLVTRGQAA